MRREIEEFDLEKVMGGIDISRHSETSGVLYYNGLEYPFIDYSGLVSVVQQCVNSGTYDDDTLFNALRNAGII